MPLPHQQRQPRPQKHHHDHNLLQHGHEQEPRHAARRDAPPPAAKRAQDTVHQPHEDERRVGRDGVEECPLARTAAERVPRHEHEQRQSARPRREEDEHPGFGFGLHGRDGGGVRLQRAADDAEDDAREIDEADPAEEEGGEGRLGLLVPVVGIVVLLLTIIFLLNFGLFEVRLSDSAPPQSLSPRSLLLLLLFDTSWLFMRRGILGYLRSTGKTDTGADQEARGHLAAHDVCLFDLQVPAAQESKLRAGADDAHDGEEDQEQPAPCPLEAVAVGDEDGERQAGPVDEQFEDRDPVAVGDCHGFDEGTDLEERLVGGGKVLERFKSRYLRENALYRARAMDR